MPAKKEETASFVLRFTQKIFKNEQQESEVQWRGNIRHVQGGEEKRFSEFKDVVDFIQEKLADLTIQAMGEKTPEEQKGILSKSFELWKRMSTTYPKIVMDTLKDPKAGVEQLQEEVNQQINQVKDTISATLDPDAWKPATKSDVQEMMKAVAQLSKEVQALNKKVNTLSK
ncbi:MAG: hypothetical protein AAF960_07880 [Bacteroidota bacterium]